MASVYNVNKGKNELVVFSNKKLAIKFLNTYKKIKGYHIFQLWNLLEEA
jgi:hypothetical protein